MTKHWLSTFTLEVRISCPIRCTPDPHYHSILQIADSVMIPILLVKYTHGIKFHQCLHCWTRVWLCRAVCAESLLRIIPTHHHPPIFAITIIVVTLRPLIWFGCAMGEVFLGWRLKLLKKINANILSSILTFLPFSFLGFEKGRIFFARIAFGQTRRLLDFCVKGDTSQLQKITIHFADFSEISITRKSWIWYLNILYRNWRC